MARHHWRVYPSRLHSSWQQTRRPTRPLWWLVLPVPRFHLRYLGTDPARAGAAESRRAALRIHLRYGDQDRLGGHDDRTRNNATRPAEPHSALDRLPAAVRLADRARPHRLSDAEEPQLLVEFR